MTSRPAFRQLRGYAFDPSLSLDLETYDVNNIIYKIRWEASCEDSSAQCATLGPGPVGEYVEVIDYDPTIGKFYRPLDLDEPYLLASDGLAPSESNPQFHQQMVYAVSMLTIQNFEKALGRKIHWAPRLLNNRKYEEYVHRLRIYPHALREANAYYSPQKKALLFGYFAATPANVATQMPGSLVFTCLSHDIIAHETTHAILDGMHRNYNRPTNPDVLAFHEAFADIVALFQHFTVPEALKHQIARTRGDLEKQNLLGQLAQQFGTAIGHYGSLRDAIGSVDEETGQWHPAEPDPVEYSNTIEPHQRGSILVAAVFDAFLSVYKRRVRDLLRIASNGTGVLVEGELHPDLVNRLAREAAKTAGHVLRMCVRALDYCPPMDITFGDYLRAIVTADADSVDDDVHRYRLAFIDAFRRRGIYPQGIKTLGEDSLGYQSPSHQLSGPAADVVNVLSSVLRQYREAVMYTSNREEIYNLTRDFIAGGRNRPGFHRQLAEKLQALDNSEETVRTFERLTGLVIQDWQDYGVRTSSKRSNPRPAYQVLNLHLVSIAGPDGKQINHIVFGLVQRMGVKLTKDGVEFYEPARSNDKDPPPLSDDAIELQGGCTLIFDLDTMDLKYSITKPLLDHSRTDEHGRPTVNVERIASQHHYQSETLPLSMSELGHYFGMGVDSHFAEPFSILHQR